MTEEQRKRKELHDQILKDWAQKGMVIRGGWEGLKFIVGKNWGATQESEMQKAFYTGAQHVFSSIMGLMGQDAEEPSEREMKVLSDIDAELKAYLEKMVVWAAQHRASNQ